MRKIFNVTHTPQEGGPYFNDLRQKLDAGVDFDCEFMANPIFICKYEQ